VIAGGRKIKFQVGDKVREGMHIGTVTDVGTLLIQLKTSDGTSRIVCPWELVKTQAEVRRSASPPTALGGRR
jgi:small-conductance mechanosensitive channel